MPDKPNWPAVLKPLLKKYKGKKHPLAYHNLYQLVVMVVLSAQATDEGVNEVTPALFKDFPNMKALVQATPESLFPYVSRIRNFANKAKWITTIARTVEDDRHIPLTMEGLTELPGIGRKSASVILREAGKPPEGIIVDIHVVRVVGRLGITKGKDAGKIEKALMAMLPASEWDIGMAMSFLGREICLPKPDCPHCLMKKSCAYYKANY